VKYPILNGAMIHMGELGALNPNHFIIYDADVPMHNFKNWAVGL
jgi:hypothetical protein